VKVLIVGGGVGGLALARGLAGSGHLDTLRFDTAEGRTVVTADLADRSAVRRAILDSSG